MVLGSDTFSSLLQVTLESRMTGIPRCIDFLLRAFLVLVILASGSPVSALSLQCEKGSSFLRFGEELLRTNSHIV